MANFQFNEENLKRAQEVLSHYPNDRKKSALVPILDLAQRQNGNYLSKEVIEYVAHLLNLTNIAVYEVASFYSMFNLKSVGKYLIQFCRTTPCMLCGCDGLVEFCEELLEIKVGETTQDGFFSLKEVECLGSCVSAPVVQINDTYYEKLTKESLGKIIDELRKS